MSLTDKQKKIIGWCGLLSCVLGVLGIVTSALVSEKSVEKKVVVETPPPKFPPKTVNPYESITQSRVKAEDSASRLTEETPPTSTPISPEPKKESQALQKAKEQQQILEYKRAQNASTSRWLVKSTIKKNVVTPPPAVRERVSFENEDLLSTDQQRQNLKVRLTELKKLKERIQSGNYSVGDGTQALFDMESEFSPPPQEVVGFTDENLYNASTVGMEVLPVGTVIPAVTTMKASSDRLGTFKALVSQDVLDVTQTYVLIPKGSEVIIKSFRMTGANEAINSVVGMSVPWIVLPDGSKVDTSKSSGLDREGMGGISDQVDYHWMEQFLGVAAYALVANNVSYDGTGADSDSSYEAEVSQGLREQIAPHAQKYLQLRPTNIIRSGQNMNIMIESDVYLKPWRNIYEDYL